MKTILISGVAGFLGSHLAEFYLKQNCKVIGVDNFITGDKENLAYLEKYPGFNFIEIDICNLRNDMIESHLDLILNFACPASPIDYLKIPIETLRTSSVGTENMLKIALKNNCTFLIASTSEVYGDPEISPQNESYWGNVNPIGPRGCYDEGKRFQEALTMAYNRKFNLDVRIARIFNTYGPRMRLNDGRVLPTFINQARKNESISIFGDGNQTRSFCFVDDLIRAIDLLAKSNYQLPMNLGNPQEITILDFAKEIVEQMSSTSNFEFHPLPENDPMQRKPDINLAREVLGWEPLISRENGIKKTISWFKETNWKGGELNFKIFEN